MTSTILFVVDVPEGRDPKKEALDALMSIASKYGQRPASWVFLEDHGGIVWDLPQDAPHSPEGGGVSCPDGPLDPETSYVFIRYIGEWGDNYGLASLIRGSPECGRDWFASILIAQDRLDKRRILWLTRRQIEERTLLHEYGHVLGLGSNPAHGYWPRVMPYEGGGHCINPECALVLPDTKTIAYGVYRTGLTFRQVHDYCKVCQQDIEWAKRHWRTGEEFPEAERLPQPDPSLAIASLKDSDFTAQGKAAQFIWVGKPAVPALMERMRTLPDGEEGSPRAIADWIVKTILVDECKKRFGETRVAWVMKDQSEKLLEWWSREGEHFVAGDEWEIPNGVITVLPGPEP